MFGKLIKLFFKITFLLLCILFMTILKCIKEEEKRRRKFCM